MSDAETQIRLASAADAPAFGRLLHAFNVELGEPTPAHCDDRGIATHVGPDLQFATAEVTKSVAEGSRLSLDAPSAASSGEEMQSA